MSLQMSSEALDDYLKVVVTGDFELNEFNQLIDSMKSLADLNKSHRIFADIRGMAGNPTTMERFSAGEHIAAIMSGYSLAFVERSERITGLAQMVAVTRGASMLMRPSEDEALEWLKGRKD